MHVRAVFCFHEDADDSFYIAQTSSILSSGYINAFEPSTGISEIPFQAQYAMVGYETWIAILCKLFHVNAAIFFHTLLPMILLPLHYFIVYKIGEKSVPNSKGLWLLLYVLLNGFSGYSVYSSGAFALLRIWQGKAILANIILPLLLLVFIDVFVEKKKLITTNLPISSFTVCGIIFITVRVSSKGRGVGKRVE